MGQHPIAAASVFWRPLLRDKFAILASAKYRDVSWSKDTGDGCLLHGDAGDGAVMHVSDAKGGGYSWRAGNANGSAKTLVDAKLDAVDAAKGVKASANGMYADTTKQELETALAHDEEQLRKMTSNLAKLKSGGKVENLNIAGAERQIEGLTGAIANKRIALAKFSASRAYNAFGLSPLALECLAAAVKAGGTYKPPAAKDGSPKALAIEELVTASAVKRNPDGSLSVVEGAERWLTQDASLKASAEGMKYGALTDQQTSFLSEVANSASGMVLGKSESLRAWGFSNGLLRWADSAETHYEVTPKGRAAAKSGQYSASDPAAVCADIHYHGTDAQRAAFGEAGDRATDPPGSWLAKCVEKIGAHGSAGKPALAYSAALFAAVDADASLKACEKVCLLYAVQGSLERNEVTFDVIDGLLARGLVEPTGDRKTYRASESAARKYGASWTEIQKNMFEAHAGDFVMDVAKMSDGTWSWSASQIVTTAGHPQEKQTREGRSKDLQSAKSAAESAARSLGAKFSAGAVEWKCVDPRQTTQVTSTERTILVRVNQDGRGVPTPEDEVTFRSLAQKGLVEMDESGAYHITPAGTDALAGGGVKSAVSDRKVDATVEKFAATAQTDTKPLHATAPRIPTGEYLAIYDEATNTYTVKDVPIFAEHQVPGAKFKIGEKWMLAAVQKAKDRATADKYVAPLHIRHHGDGEGTTRAGFVMPTEVKHSMYEGRETFVLYADLVGIPPEVYADIKARKLPYRSVEINKVDVPEISSLALLEDEVPYFRLPMLGIGEEAGGAPKSIAASARRIRQSASMTPCVAYAESATGRATYLYSEAGMAKLAAGGKVMKYASAWWKTDSGAFALGGSVSNEFAILAWVDENGKAKWSIAKQSDTMNAIRKGESPSIASAKSAAEQAARSMGAKFAAMPAGARKYASSLWRQLTDKSWTIDIAKTGGYAQLMVVDEGGGAWSWSSSGTGGSRKSGPASSKEDAMAKAEAAGRAMGAKFSQSSNGGTQMKRYDEMTPDEQDEAVTAKMAELKMQGECEDDDDETLRAKARAALRLAAGDQPNLDDEDPTKLADVLQGDTPLTEGATAKPGSPGGQPGANEALARQFGAMTKVLGSIAAGQKRMIGMMAKAYDMSVDDDEEPVKAAAGDVPGEDDDEGPVEMKASAKMAARLTTVEGKLARAESSAKIDRAVKYALRELDGYSVGDPEDVEKRIRAGAMKYGEGWIKEYLSDVKKLAPKAPTDGDEPGIGDENVGDLPEFVLKYRAGGPEKLEHVIGLHRTWMDLKSRGQGTFAKDDTSEKFIKASMHYSAVDGNGVVK